MNALLVLPLFSKSLWSRVYSLFAKSDPRLQHDTVFSLEKNKFMKNLILHE